MDFSIGQRLALAFGAILLLLVMAGATSFHQIRQLEQLERHRTDVVAHGRDAAIELRRAYLLKGLSLRSYGLTRGEDEIQRVRAAKAEARSAWAVLDSITPPGEAALLAEARTIATEYDRQADDFLESVESRKAMPAAVESNDSSLTELRNRLFAALDALEDTHQEKQVAIRTEAARARSRLVHAGVVLLVLVLGVGMGSAFLVTRGVRRQTGRMLHASRALESGDFGPACALASDGENAIPAGTPPRDELRELAGSFGRTAIALRGKEQRISAHAAVAETLASSIEVEGLTQGTLEVLASKGSCEVGAIYLLDKEPSLLRRVAGYADQRAAAAIPLGEGVPGQSAASRTTVVVRDIPQDGPFRIRLGFQDVVPRAMAAVPIPFQDELLGVLVVGSLREIPADQVRFLEGTARQLGVSLQNALAHQQMRDLARNLELKNEQLQDQFEEIQAQNEEIQAQNEEIQAQNEELEVQKEELFDADRQKDELISIASHELRSPLAALRMQVELLARAFTKTGNTKPMDLAANLERLTRLADRTSAGVDRLLDYSRAQMGRIQLQPEPVDLVLLLRDLLDQIRTRFPDREITVTTPGPTLLLPLDRGYVDQALRNVIENAIRYSPRGGEVLVKLREEAGEVRFSVEDHGIGIPEDKLTRVFEPSYRLEEAREVSAEGMGLGLYITRAIAKAHGGRIWAESEVGKYTRFTIALPREPLKQLVEGTHTVLPQHSAEQRARAR